MKESISVQITFASRNEWDGMSEIWVALCGNGKMHTQNAHTTFLWKRLAHTNTNSSQQHEYICTHTLTGAMSVHGRNEPPSSLVKCNVYIISTSHLYRTVARCMLFMRTHSNTINVCFNDLQQYNVLGLLSLPHRFVHVPLRMCCAGVVAAVAVVKKINHVYNNRILFKLTVKSCKLDSI